MGRLLSEGGFCTEALAPVHQAVELAVRALALLSGDDAAGANDDPIPAAALHKQIVSAGLLLPADAAQVSALREMASSAASIVEKTDAALMRVG